jgi:hypothetical protein
MQAKENLETRGVSNFELFVGDSKDLLPSFLQKRVAAVSIVIHINTNMCEIVCVCCVFVKNRGGCEYSYTHQYEHVWEIVCVCVFCFLWRAVWLVWEEFRNRANMQSREYVVQHLYCIFA